MRVISLLPGATDSIVALGGVGFLVGISHSCTAVDAGHGPLAALPRLTVPRVDAASASAAIDAAVREFVAAGRPLFALDHAAIERLQPDVIITQALCDVCAVSESEVRELAARIPSRPEVLSLAGSTIDGILTDVALIADALELTAEADELIPGLRRRMHTVHDTLKAARAPRPRVAVIEWTEPLFTAGHWVPEQVRRAGGIGVLGEPGAHSRTLTPDQLRAADPEIVIVAPCGFALDRAMTEAERLVAIAPWLEKRSVWAMDGDTLTSRPGPGMVAGIETMAQIVAPSLFAPVSASRARRLIPR